MNGHARRAFTLIELLVVIAIISVLVTLLVPGVQKVRSLVTAIQCRNNMRQIGIAIRTYEASIGFLPAAFTSPPETFQPAPLNHFCAGWGWGAAILPYLDQAALHHAINVDTMTMGSPGAGTIGTLAAPTPFTQTKIAVYRCPADTGPTLDPERSNFALSNYRVTCGPNSTGLNVFKPNFDWGGCMHQNSRIRMDQITDGPSNTLIIGECMYDWNPTTQTGRQAAIWAGMRGTDFSTHISDVMWWMDNNTATINGPALQAFSSRHGGGAYALFCDGTVRFIREGVDTSIIIYLAGRRDGVQVSTSDYVY